MIILSCIGPETMSFHPEATDRHVQNHLRFSMDPDDSCPTEAVMKDLGMQRVRYSVLMGTIGVGRQGRHFGDDNI